MIWKRNIRLTSVRDRPFLVDVCYSEGHRQPIVIFSHGFKGFKDWGVFDLMAAQFARAGMIFVKFNFSMNGTTPEAPLEISDLEAFGNNNFSIELDDLGTVIDWVQQADFPVADGTADTQQIYLIGHSRGGGITLLKAGEDERVKRVAVWGSVNEFGKFWKGSQMEAIRQRGVLWVENTRTQQQLPVYWQLYEDYYRHPERLFIPDVVKRMQQPLLVAHGTQDEAVPYSAAVEMQQWKPDARLVTIENGNHVFGARHPWDLPALPADYEKVVQETIAFFKQ